MAEHQQRELGQVLSKLRSRIKRLRESGAHVGEENTKATLVEPLLASLGWDIEEPDEVHREYRKKPQDPPVDYALCMVRTPRLFVEVKSLEKNLDDRRWASQVLGYATVVGVEWCVLTNGDDYRLYNAHAAVDVEEKLFRRIAISDEAASGFTEDTLDLISKARLREKRLTLLWEAHHVDSQIKGVLEALWAKPEPSLLRLIRKNAKGLKPGEIRASLQRGRIRIDFPVESAEGPAKRKRAVEPPGKRSRGSKRGGLGLPLQSTLEVPLLLEIVERGGAIEMRTRFEEIATALANKFSLTAKQRAARTKNEGTTLWKNRLQWVRQRLIKKGHLDGSERGVWRITAQGQTRVGTEGRRGLSLVEPK